MQLDITTFVLEIVNFLVLLWLLTRFLYKPLRAAIEARAEATVRAAQALQQQGAALDARAAGLDAREAELRRRLDDAGRELEQQIAALRRQRLDALARELEAERAKARTRLARNLQRARRQGERELHQRAAGFVAEYLKRLASPSLETALVELFLDDLAREAGAVRAMLHDAWPAPGAAPPMAVRTAYAAPPGLRERVEAEVGAVAGCTTRAEWRIDPELIAGIRIDLPAHQLEASLRRGVDAFAAGPA